MNQIYTKICVVILFALLWMMPSAEAQNGIELTDFRSVTSGNWESASTWQISYDHGANWIIAHESPSYSSANIEIRNTHKVTINTDITVDQLTIKEGGVLDIPDGRTLTIFNGKDEVDLMVYGSLSNSGSVKPLGSLAFGKGGLYVHDRDGGIIPHSSWDPGSNCEINNVKSVLPSGLEQTFGNFSWKSGNSSIASIPTSITGDLEIDKNARLILSGNTNVNGLLNMSSGIIELGAYDLTVAGIKGGSANAFVMTSGTGMLKSTVDPETNITFPVGLNTYTPVTLTNHTGSSQLYSVRLLGDMYSAGLSGAPVTQSHVKRIWDINMDGSNTGNGVDLSFGWNSSEQPNNFTPALYRFQTNKWVMQSDASAKDNHSLTYKGYKGSFSLFSIAAANSFLPVIWRSFTANKKDGGVWLQWSTTSEQNIQDFVVERSKDGLSWERIAVVSATGNTSSSHQYVYLDGSVWNGTVLYRILQQDLDGREGYSAVVKLEMSGVVPTLKMFPNPVIDHSMLTYTNAPAGTSYRVMDLAGRLMQSGAVQQNSTQMRIDMPGLKTGNYILILEGYGIRNTRVFQKL